MPAMNYQKALTHIGRAATGSLKDLREILMGILDNDIRAPLNLTAAATLDRRTHAGRICTINSAAGLTFTLPASTGGGDRYRFFIGTTITSIGTIIKVANATDIMVGFALAANNGANTSDLWETASTSDTITMDGSNTGGTKGDYIELEDVSAGVWRVWIVMAETGSTATPFSATVS